MVNEFNDGGEPKATPPAQNEEQNLQNTDDKTVQTPDSAQKEAARPTEQPAAHSKMRDVNKLAKEIEEKQQRDTKAKRRNWWIKTGLLLALIVFSVYLMFTITHYLTEEGSMSFSDMIAGIDVTYLLIFLGVIVVYMLVESLKYSYLLKISTGKWRLKNSIKTMFLGKYYDGITPLGTGGQPFQIYYLHKKDIPSGVATAVPLVRYIVSTFVFCLFAAGMLIFASVADLLKNWEGGGDWSGTVILVVAWISLAFNLAVPVIMLFVSLFPRMGKKLILKIIGLLSKMHIVKHRYPVMKKYVYEADEYKESLHLLFTEWYKLFPLLILCIIETVMYFSIPFFAVLAIAGPDVFAGNQIEMWVQIMCLASISFYAASMIPTPGNSGASEAMTAIVFLNVGGIGRLIAYIILLWRFATFYVYIISGVGINIFEIIRSAIRNSRAAKKSKPKQ